MKVIAKYNKNDFNGFDWLNYDNLPKSDGYKFEIYIDRSNDIVADLIFVFYFHHTASLGIYYKELNECKF